MSAQTLASLAWRRALKHFAPSITPIDISPILNAAILAPTSFGVQPFQIYVVTSANMKAKISPAAFCQPQITECSHLLIFASRNDASPTVERCITAHKFDQNAPEYAKYIRQCLSGLDSPTFSQWSSNQAHIALGFSLAAAADLRIGSCPMGGFDAEALGKVLNLGANENVAVLLAIGTASSDDKKSNPYPKYRMQIEDVVTHID